MTGWRNVHYRASVRTGEQQQQQHVQFLWPNGRYSLVKSRRIGPLGVAQMAVFLLHRIRYRTRLRRHMSLEQTLRILFARCPRRHFDCWKPVDYGYHLRAVDSPYVCLSCQRVAVYGGSIHLNILWASSSARMYDRIALDMLLIVYCLLVSRFIIIVVNVAIIIIFRVDLCGRSSFKYFIEAKELCFFK